MTRRAYAVLIFFVAILILFSPLFLPLNAQAPPQFPGDTGPGGIVPCGDYTDQGIDKSCEFCHLVALAQDTINFAVYFTVFVATLLFVYAGFLYITAGGDTGKISQAMGIFGKVIVGLIIVLVAWLVIDTIMKTFFVGSELNQGFGPWNEVECSGPLPSNPVREFEGVETEDLQGEIFGGESSEQAGTLEVISEDELPSADPASIYPVGYEVDTRSAVEKAENEEAMRDVLSDLCESDPSGNCSISVNKPNCLPNQSFTNHPGGCTDLTLLQAETLVLIEKTARECGALESQTFPDSKCLVLITGGSELGHISDSAGCSVDTPSHCSGNKVDISVQVAAVNRYVEDDSFFGDGQCPDQRSGRVHKENGSCWVLEDNHWDVTRFLE